MCFSENFLFLFYLTGRESRHVRGPGLARAFSYVPLSHLTPNVYVRDVSDGPSRARLVQVLLHI